MISFKKKTWDILQEFPFFFSSFFWKTNFRFIEKLEKQGIQFILAIRAAFNQEMYDLQVIVMGRQQQQQPQVQIQQMPQMQQNFMYQKAAPVSMQPSVPSYTPQN